MINPAKFLKLKSTWERFSMNHPKFVSFLATLQNNFIKEGTVIEINVKTEEGKSICSNIRLSKEDIDMFSEFSEILKP